MKKFVSFLILIISTFFCYAKNNLGINYHIGDDILFTKNDIHYSYQGVNVSIENEKSFFIDTGFMFLLNKNMNTKNYSDFSTNIGLNFDIGRKFYFDFIDLFSIAPCFTSDIFFVKQDDFTSDNLFQIGTKLKFEFYIPIKKIQVTLGFSPQFNFLNILNTSVKKTKIVSVYNSEKSKYEEEPLSYAFLENEKTWKSFSYEFCIDVNYTY